MSIDVDALPGTLRKPNRADAYLRVLHALMLRDMRNRFAASYWGWGVQVFWPVAHMFVIASVLAFRGVPSPMGDSTMLFIATGAVPALAFQYISREMMKGLGQNKPLTYYPHVKVFDVISARMLVEIVNSFCGLVVICSILLGLGINPFPVDILQSIGGYLAAIVLGIGVGTVNVGIVSIFPGWIFGFILFTILVYMASGVVFMPIYLPEQVYSILKWNPVLQIVEWVRLGYDPTLPIEVDYTYVLLWAGCSMALGLLFERLIVRHAS